MTTIPDQPRAANQSRSLDWAAQTIAGQDGFQRAAVVLEIGGGDFKRVATLAEAFPTKVFFSIDMAYAPSAVRTVREFAATPNLNVIKVRSDQRVFADGMFDFVFSSAVMEHIPAIDSFLSEMWRITRRGGEHYFIEAPFWSSYKGHHYKHHDPTIAQILGNYKHLLFSRQEMASYLHSFDSVPFKIEECLWSVYDRPDLSRLSRNETLASVERSQFKIREWIDIPDELFNTEHAEMVVLQKRYSLEDLKIKGAYVALSK